MCFCVAQWSCGMTLHWRLQGVSAVGGAEAKICYMQDEFPKSCPIFLPLALPPMPPPSPNLSSPPYQQALDAV